VKISRVQGRELTLFISLLQNSDMAHLKDLNLVYYFQTETLEKALEDWKVEQLDAYLDNEKAKNNILVAVQSMQEFMCSQHVVNNGMVVKQLMENNLKTRK
jgi:hypothetical protein